MLEAEGVVVVSLFLASVLTVVSFGPVSEKDCGGTTEGEFPGTVGLGEEKK